MNNTDIIVLIWIIPVAITITVRVLKWIFWLPEDVKLKEMSDEAFAALILWPVVLCLVIAAIPVILLCDVARAIRKWRINRQKRNKING